ncbi:MAG: hypothetical protein CMP52_07170 [Flavobacteriales bacterium]|nr:hypothetical protein [Candidatus Arcticimaribacter sp.]
MSERYSIDNKTFHIENENGIQLHGGQQGWSGLTWKITDLYHGTIPHFILEHECLPVPNGHPGIVKVSLKYSLHRNIFQIEYKATTTKSTPINMTNHSYFNLSGVPKLFDHELQINADQVLELNPDLLPTVSFIEVNKTDFDRNKIRSINNSRYDDCFVLRQKDTVKAILRAKTTKIQMDVLTDQPGIVVFKPEIINGICLETQKFSNGPNIPHFPNTILHPNERYYQKTQYFSQSSRETFGKNR